MPTQLTSDDARQTLNAHASGKGAEIFEKYGPEIGWKQLLQILQDRSCVRFSCEIAFDAAPLGPGEFAHPVARGETPEEGYTLCIHPCFMTQLKLVPFLALYQLVLVNYGEFASSDDAEAFGASALGIAREDYYQILCEAADQLGGLS